MRASRKLRRAAVEHSTQRGVAVLINEIMPSLIQTMRRMHDIQSIQNARLWKLHEDTHPTEPVQDGVRDA